VSRVGSAAQTKLIKGLSGVSVPTWRSTGELPRSPQFARTSMPRPKNSWTAGSARHELLKQRSTAPLPISLMGARSSP